MPKKAFAKHEIENVESQEHKESLEELQAVRFAKDFSKIYKAEKQKRKCLEETNVELKHRNEELMDFAFLASSDLKEPLSKMNYWIDQFIQEAKKTGLNENKSLGEIRKSVRRLHQLIDEISQFYRVNSVFVNFKPVYLKDVLAENLSDLELLFNASGVNLEIGELPILETDPIQLRILFQNILVNVLRFNKMEQNKSIKVFAERKDEGFWRIIFRGNGQGFELEKLKIILSPDFNDDDRFEINKEEMGLSLCKKIVKRLGGSLYGEASNEGSFSFNIVLPEKAIRHSYQGATG
jgi:light-regulated signal transduction histidine kinase (bacteriophytochrome)